MYRNIPRVSFLLFLIFNLSYCETNNIVTSYNTENVEPTNSKGNIFPSPLVCGIDKKNNVIDHTWLVRLKYTSDEFGCGGAVLNGRYVLTAASCLVGEIVEKLGELKSITLFENSGDRLNKEYAIEETVIHAKYIPNNLHGQNDVALIRLAQNINLAATTPICTDGYEAIDREREPYVEGWGQTLAGQLSTIRKLQKVKFVSTAACQELLTPFSYELTTRDVCITLNAKDYDTACPVDGGGVLVNRYKSRWWLLGIASYNAECGQNARPGIFTKYHKIYTWVQNSIRP